MTPGSLVLLHPPGASAASWGDLPEALRSAGFDVAVPDAGDDTGARYVARTSLLVAASAPAAPLVLVARGAAGPLAPAIALAQRAARRPVGAHVFVDADLPRLRDHGHDHGHDAPRNTVPVPPDWPDVPCGYLRTGTSPAHDPAAKQARLRGWPVTEHPERTSLAQSLTTLITTL